MITIRAFGGQKNTITPIIALMEVPTDLFSSVYHIVFYESPVLNLSFHSMYSIFPGKPNPKYIWPGRLPFSHWKNSPLAKIRSATEGTMRVTLKTVHLKSAINEFMDGTGGVRYPS